MRVDTVSVIGTGYVGLVTGACLAEKGFNVYCVDLVPEKVKRINQGQSPIYEPQLDEILKRNVKKRTLIATLDLKNAILNSEISFTTVDTPSKPSGDIDLKSLSSAAEEIGKALKEREGHHIAIVKSTVIPGTTENIFLPRLTKKSGNKIDKGFDVAFSPEFLREGSAVTDFLKPDRVIIGAKNNYTAEAVEKIFYWLKEDTKILRTDIKTAEMIKYASNAFLATKISFINEIANMCEKLGVSDVYKVAEGVGLDHRISEKFLRAGCGFGGSCFPKDVRAIIYAAEKADYEPILLKKVLEVNEKQPFRLIELAKKEVENLERLNVLVLGLAFKPETDDIRESPAMKVIDALLKEGAKVTCYDPEAINNTKEEFGEKIRYVNSVKDGLFKADLCIIVTNWREFEELEPQLFLKQMKKAVVIDGRKTLDSELFSKSGVRYRRIGKSSNSNS